MKPITELEPEEGKVYKFYNKDTALFPLILKYTNLLGNGCSYYETYDKSYLEEYVKKNFSHFEEWQPEQINKTDVLHPNIQINGTSELDGFFHKQNKMRKVTDLKENECIHCVNVKEARAICKLMHKAKLKWIGGFSYIHATNWDKKIGNIVYYPSNGTYESVEYAKDEKDKIYKASEFLPPEFYYEKPSLEKEINEVDKANEKILSNENLLEEINGLKQRVARLEKTAENHLEQIEDLEDYNVKKELTNDPEFNETAEKIMNIEKEEVLTVDGILKEVGFLEPNHVCYEYGEKGCEIKIPKQVLALWKLQAIADKVNEGLEFKDKPWFPHLINGNFDMDFYANKDEVISSPIKIHPEMKDVFKSIKGIDKLIKDYLG